MRPSMIVALVVFVVVPACDGAPPPASELTCPGGPLDDDRVTPCATGGGVFGTWETDAQGLPAYRATLPVDDPRGAWTLSDERERRDQLFFIGNDRVLGVVSSTGFAELFVRDRGPTYLNRADARSGQTAGGYSVVVTPGETFASAPLLAPAAARVERTAGLGYVEVVTQTAPLTVTHRLMTPPGDDALLLDEVVLENTTADVLPVRHLEVFDVNRHPIEVQLLRSGTLAPEVPRDGDAVRDAINAAFRLAAVVDEGGRAVRVIHAYTGDDAPPRDVPSARDFDPHDIYLARLAPAVDDAHPLVVHTDGAAFSALTEELTQHPDVARAAMPELLNLETAQGEPAVLVDEVALSLAPGARVTLRYAFGAIAKDRALEPVLARHDDARVDLAARHAAVRKSELVRARADGIPHLDREMSWHASKLVEAAMYDEGFGAHTVVQGSAYLFLHGLDGAARDFALFALPLVYVRPDLAREILRTLARMRYDDTHQLSYAVQGMGMLEDAAVHTAPSDVDLFFLWALSEYVAATGDRAFLDERHPLWPPMTGEVLALVDHAAVAARHFLDDVGTGPHGLVRVGSGDWSDGIVFQAPDRATAETQGESVPNSQMALYVLPRAAALLDETQPALAAELRAFVDALRPVVEAQWVDDRGWYRRAWFGVDEPYGEGHLNLEAQIWALVAEVPDAARRDALVEKIHAELDETSPIGARRVPDGEVWHAITGLLTWGYGRSDPARAFASLARHSMHAFAEANPTSWSGIWTSPDALFVDGGTWSSPATPMTDYPAANQNQHALPLLALLRTAGIEPEADGALGVRPVDATRALVVDTPLLRVETSDGVIRGEYRAARPGEVTLVVGARGTAGTRLTRVVAAGERFPFEVTAE